MTEDHADLEVETIKRADGWYIRVSIDGVERLFPQLKENEENWIGSFTSPKDGVVVTFIAGPHQTEDAAEAEMQSLAEKMKYFGAKEA